MLMVNGTLLYLNFAQIFVHNCTTNEWQRLGKECL